MEGIKKLTPLALAAGLWLAPTAEAEAGHVSSQMEEAASYPQQDMDQMICIPAFGWFGAMSVPVPPCESDVGLCTAGELSGVLNGQYALEMDQLMSTNDPRVPFVNFFTGTSVIDSTYGEFVGVDTGSMNLSPPGDTGSGRFSTLLTILEGGAGFIHIRGKLDLATGNVSGTYAGLVCWDWDDMNHGWGGW
ncbi:MAG: hypothetical protein ACRBN8_35160 [Nannocystales bacterium]